MTDIPLIKDGKAVWPNGIRQDAFMPDKEPYVGVVKVGLEPWTFLSEREDFIKSVDIENAAILKDMREYFLEEYDRRLVKRQTLRAATEE